MKIRFWLTLVAALTLLCLPASLNAQNLFRIEVRPVQTVTLKTQQVLTGDQNGKPVVIAGELRIPKPGTDKLPAVILVHGSGGVGASIDRWAQELNSIGVVAFILELVFRSRHHQHGQRPVATRHDSYDGRCLPCPGGTRSASAGRPEPNRHRGVLERGRGCSLFEQSALPEAVCTGRRAFRRPYRDVHAVQHGLS